MEIFLHEIRRKKGITLKDLSARSGVSTSHISDIEKGHKAPTIPTMCKIASALEVSCSGLFNCED